MTDSGIDELQLYVSNHCAWRLEAAPRIAAVLAATTDDDRLIERWRMLRQETKESVWKQLDDALRDRLKALSAERS
ncbi:hypothetical protein [Dyella ginsengisoli]|uniref:hypothetical protein n=1 Tax=Dyella ginsengisoli TaxID=363848 RepID=UPI000347EB52|nr:hypothetical protein [Dyella ginsengisoli]